MSFRGKMFLFFGLSATVVLIVTILTVSNRIHHFSELRTRNELSEAPMRFDHFQQARMNSLIAEASNVSNDPNLRGALSTSDRPTIIQAAEETYRLFPTDLFWILDNNGQVIYRVEQPQVYGDNLAKLPLIEDVLNGYDSGDIWLWRDRLYQVSAVPIFSGSHNLGIFLMGKSFDSWITGDFAELTGVQLFFVHDRQVIHSSLKNIETESLTEVVCTEENKKRFNEDNLPLLPSFTDQREKEPDKPLILNFSMNDEHYASTLFELGNIQSEKLATGLLARSMRQEKILLARVQAILIGISVITLLLSLLASYLLSRSLSRPINRLVECSARLAGDDLDTPIPVDSKDEIGILAKALEEMRVSLKEAREQLIRNERLSIVGRMASTITHDFRQPISVIHGSMEMLALPNITPEQRERFINRVSQQINRMQGMINELLDFTKGDVRLRFKDVVLSEFLLNVVSNFEHDSEVFNIQVKAEIEWDGVIRIDPARIERGCENIIRNGMQAIGRDGEIVLRTRLVDNHVAISIHDNGPGIPEEIRENLFEPFVSHGKKDGTGLGLAVVSKVIREHKGEIHVNSERGVGTTFELLLPLNSKKEPADAS